MSIQERLKKLRELMRSEKIDYYLITNTDPHQNEYLPEAWQRYTYISGFTGSNATILVGLDQAYFWTDSRYTEQSKLEVSPKLFKIYIQGQDLSLEQFIAKYLHDVSIGVDPSLIGIQQVQNLNEICSQHENKLVFIKKNLIDACQKTLPALKHEKIFILEDRYTGEKALSKLTQLREFIKQQKADALVLNELPSISWLLNLRGKDIDHNPLFFSYAIVTLKGCLLFVDNTSLTPKVSDYLKRLQVEILPYDSFYSTLTSLTNYRKVILEPRVTNQAILNALSAHEIQFAVNPIHLWKACKNKTEISGARTAHKLDAIALIRFFNWLETNFNSVSEVSLAEKLFEFRSQAKSFQGTSFDTIAGFADHGAIVHYHAEAKTDRKITDQGLLLLDSGGQYLEGTTDITRTIHLGEPTELEKQCYTLVLKGHIALKNAIFPAGTRGDQLDSLARQFLWNAGYNYGHGTGHGVGAFLCVHEGPQSISTSAGKTALQANMILSNEPGVYLPGQFGIRIENLVYVTKAEIPKQDFGEFYTFENLTLVPYARKLIQPELLTPEEIAAINEYHTTILEELGSALDVDALRWLIHATQPL